MFLGNQLLKVFFDDALSVRAVLCWTKFGKNLASDFFEPKFKIGTSIGFGNAFPVNLSGHCFHRSTSFYFFFRGDYFSTRRKGATVLKFGMHA